MFVVWFPETIAGGNKEERRRAVTVSALRHCGLPPVVIRMIASNGHETRDRDGLEMGFFPENEWKRLKRVFRPNELVSQIRWVIDQYEDARGACQNSPEIAPRVKVEREVIPGEGFRILIWFQFGTMQIEMNQNHEIIRLTFSRFRQEDIDDLTNLPPNLIEFAVWEGYLSNFEFSKLPKGLKNLIHPGTGRSRMEPYVQIQSLPHRLETLHLVKYRHKGVVLKLPLPQGLRVRVPKFDGLVFHPEPEEINTITEDLRTRETTLQLIWNDGTHIFVIHG